MKGEKHEFILYRMVLYIGRELEFRLQSLSSKIAFTLCWEATLSRLSSLGGAQVYSAQNGLVLWVLNEDLHLKYACRLVPFYSWSSKFEMQKFIIVKSCWNLCRKKKTCRPAQSIQYSSYVVCLPPLFRLGHLVRVRVCVLVVILRYLSVLPYGPYSKYLRTLLPRWFGSMRSPVCDLLSLLLRSFVSRLANT